MLKKYEFTRERLSIKVMAQDGHTAWETLSLLVPMLDPTEWSINVVCPCGRPGRGYHYCSERCYLNNRLDKVITKCFYQY